MRWRGRSLNRPDFGFSLQQFSEVFKTRDGAGQPYLLVGGQAVNYWAERYLVTAPELANLQPFTSEDIDFKGTREDVDRIARQLDSTALYPHRVAMTALAGIIPFQVGRLKSSIEVVRRLPGIRAWRSGWKARNRSLVRNRDGWKSSSQC